jgi:hypothetical protein
MLGDPFLQQGNDAWMSPASWRSGPGIERVLVLCVIVPIEVLDIWFGHVRLPRWFSSDTAGRERKGESDAYKAYERIFVPVSLPVLLTTVVVILWLAVARPV